MPGTDLFILLLCILSAVSCTACVFWCYYHMRKHERARRVFDELKLRRQLARMQTVHVEPPQQEGDAGGAEAPSADAELGEHAETSSGGEPAVPEPSRGGRPEYPAAEANLEPSLLPGVNATRSMRAESMGAPLGGDPPS